MNNSAPRNHDSTACDASSDASAPAMPAAMPVPPRLAYSVKETAAMLGISEKSVRRLVARNLLHPSKALRHLLFAGTEIERFLADTR